MARFNRRRRARASRRLQPPSVCRSNDALRRFIAATAVERRSNQRFNEPRLVIFRGPSLWWYDAAREVEDIVEVLGRVRYWITVTSDDEVNGAGEFCSRFDFRGMLKVYRGLGRPEVARAVTIAARFCHN